MRKFQIGKAKYTIPPPSKFDMLSPEDLYTATEQAMRQHDRGPRSLP